MPWMEVCRQKVSDKSCHRGTEKQSYGCSSYPGGFSSKNEIKPKTAGILRVMPCTVSQLLSSREHRDSFFIRDMELNQVTVVGMIRRTELTLTHIVYSVDDMTGPPLDVKQWQNLEHHRSMVAFNIRRLDDLNEITSHMLEVIQAHLDSDSSSCSMMKTSHASDPATVGFTASQRQVYTSIKSCRLAEGISMQRLRNSLKHLSAYDIRNCLQFLINEGHIFSTIDDYHYKCTNG
ncbi:hypothetical protein KOW79_010667 [Hemibagrus wyckioides]|uniref:Replication protein A C-terminal domain-containing protein n=1 Tax=Hemibagrus wyckioides TaxID=337641 RepID=A0A9D3NRP9_9TELE|nr:hypothetical protein KOW79_010667 [Hemibagrus wyckioides]